MDSSAAQNVRKTTGSQKRRRSDPVNRIERAKLAVNFEKANPKPVAHLGPVPPVAEQMAELMTNPSWVMRQMQRHQDDQREYAEEEFDESLDDDPDWFTGYELMEMDPIPVEPPPESPQSGPQPEAHRADGRSQEDVIHKSPDGRTPPEGSSQAGELVGNSNSHPNPQN